jgi:hypothetical protein
MENTEVYLALDIMRADYPSREELNAMTFQVGLVGSDGLVIASDRLLQQIENGGRSASLSSKFLSGDAVICCWSGDSVAEHIANVVRGLSWGDVSSERESVREMLKCAGDMALSEMEQDHMRKGWVMDLRVTRKVIVAFRDMLWLLDVRSPASIANQVYDRVVAGDADNTARCFANKFALGCQKRPVKELVRLAAYAVLAAGDENPHGVRKLEIVVIPKGNSPIFLASEHEQELEDLSNQLNISIAEHLFEPFACS